jgi:hypothetical protein
VYPFANALHGKASHGGQVPPREVNLGVDLAMLVTLTKATWATTRTLLAPISIRTGPVIRRRPAARSGRV